MSLRQEGAQGTRASAKVVTLSARESSDGATIKNPAGPLHEPTLVGRDKELEQLRTAYDAAASGRGRLVLLFGEAGIGKSSLADAVSETARDQGGRVLWGRCWQGGGAPIFWPWIRIIRSCIKDLEADSLTHLMDGAAPYLAHMVPEICTLVPGLEPVGSLESEHARFSLFDAVTTFLRRAATDRPLVVVLDDLHAADSSSLLLLHFVARELRGARVLVLGTYRDAEARLSRDTGRLLADIGREGSTISLRRLSEKQVADYLEQRLGTRVDPRLVAKTYERTAGNPFFLDETIHLIVGSGNERSLSDPVLRRSSLTEGIREAMRARLRPLTDQARALLSIASALGNEFSLTTLRFVTGMNAEELLGLVHQAELGGVLVERPGAIGRYGFAHELIRESLYEDLGGVERALVHRQVGEGLEKIHSPDLDSCAAQLAYHFSQAAHAGDAEKAVLYCAKAAERAMDLLAYEEAVTGFERTLEALETTAGDETRRCELLLSLGAAQMRAGRSSGSRQSFRQAAAIAQKLGAAQLLTRAALLYGDWASQRWVPDQELIRLLEDALESLDGKGGALRARVMAQLATALHWSGCQGRIEELSAEAVEMARMSGDRAALVFALHARQKALFHPDHAHEVLTIATERVGLAEAERHGELALLARHDRITSLLMIGDLSAAQREMDTFVRESKELRQPFFSWMSTALRAGKALVVGRLDEAERFLLDAVAMAEQLESPMPLSNLAPVASYFCRESGRFDELMPVIERLYEEYEGAPLAACQQANLHVAVGNRAQGQRDLERLAADELAAIPRDGAWLSCVALLSEAAALLTSTALAETLYRTLLPHARLHVSVSGFDYRGPVGYYLAVLATALERWDAADEHFSAAIEACTATGAVVWELRCRYEYARMLLSRNAEGDRTKALELLEQVIAPAKDMKLKLADDAASLKSEAEESLPESPNSETSHSQTAVFSSQGDYWAVGYRGSISRIRACKGLGYLHHLIRNPNHDVHVLDLVAAVQPVADGGPARISTRNGSGELAVRADIGDAGELLDAQAKAAYKARLSELSEELEEAEAFGDAERAARAKEETDFLVHELARAVGLGGRDRKAASAAERARVSATKAVKATIKKIGRHNPELGRHLAKTVKTGIFCSYSVGSADLTWEL